MVTSKAAARVVVGSARTLATRSRCAVSTEPTEAEIEAAMSAWWHGEHSNWLGGAEEAETQMSKALAAVLPLYRDRLREEWEAERDDCRHESLSGDNPGESPTTWRCDSCTYWVYAHGVTKEHDDRVRERLLTDLADQMREYVIHTDHHPPTADKCEPWLRRKARKAREER